MEESRVFRVPFSSRSVSRHETKSGAGGNLFQPICVQSWLVAHPSRVQPASMSAFPPCKGAAAPDQVRFVRPLSQPEKIYFTLDIWSCQGQYEIHVCMSKLYMLKMFGKRPDFLRVFRCASISCFQVVTY